MFAAGDEAASKQNILPLYEKHAKQLSDSKRGVKNQYGGYGVIVEERGQDPLFDSFLDRYGISPAQYSEIHQKAGNRVIYDPGLKMSAPLLELAGGRTALKGIGNLLLNRGMKETGEYAAVKATGNMGPPLVTPIMKPSTTLSAPGRSAAIATSLPLISGAAAVPQDDEDEEAPLVALDQTQVELDKIKTEAEAKAKSEAEKAKADKVKTKQEIENVNSILKVLDLEDKENREAFIQKRQERKNRNTGIFLNEMSKAFAATDNLADGIAIGAANSSDAVMNADELERLEDIEAGKDLKKLMADAAKDDKISDQDWQDLTKRYQESATLLQKQGNLMSIVDELDAAAASGSVTGINGIIGRLIDDIAGFTGVGGDIVGAATKAVNQGKFLTAQSITEILQEGGKTVSDRDRDLIKDIMANFESWFMTKGEARDNLGRVRVNMQSAFNKSKADLIAIKRKFGKQIPELEEYDKIYGISTTQTDQKDDATMLDPSLIKPVG